MCIVANIKISNPSDCQDVSHDAIDCSASDSDISSEFHDESQVCHYLHNILKVTYYSQVNQKCCVLMEYLHQ